MQVFSFQFSVFRKVSWGLVLVCLAATGIAKAQGPPGNQPADAPLLLDGFLVRATAAAGAANIIKEADEHRRAARLALQAGRGDEALRLLRRANEHIAASIPEGDARHDDAFLQDYLHDLKVEMVGIEGGWRSLRSVDRLGVSKPQVSSFPTYHRGAGHTSMNAGLVRLAAYRPMMARIFNEEGVPQWLLAVGLVESGYSPDALSPKNALGIWQFIPETGKRYGLHQAAFNDERQDPEKSTRAAARYLRDLYALFGDWPLALAAYNAGDKRVAQALERAGVRDFWALAQGGFLPAETVRYVPAVLAASRLILEPPSGKEKQP